MPLIDVYVSAEGRDLNSVLEETEEVIHSMESELPEALDHRNQRPSRSDARRTSSKCSSASSPRSCSCIS